MIRPKSSFATLISNTDVSLLVVSLISTASGLLTKDLARYWTKSFMKNRLAGFFLFLDQFGNRLRWFGALFDPRVDFVLIELDAARFDS